MTLPKLALIPSGYKGGINPTVYSILPNNGDGDFTFSRSGTATRVNKDGLIETVDSNVPRLDYSDSNCPSLLLEPTRTNYLLNSNNASQWSTFTSNGTITREANYSTAPDGTQTATRLQASVTGSGYALLFPRTFTLTSGSYSLSVYVKSNTQSNQEVAFYGLNTTVTNYTVTDEWQRLELTGTASGQAYILLGILTENAGYTNPIDISVWGGQLEAGSYPTSYIPTEGSAETRLKDECLNGGDIDLFNITEGTFFVDATPYDSGNVTVIGLSIGNDAQKIIFQFQTNGTQVRIFSSGGVSSYLSLTFNQRNKIAVTFKENEYKFFINGALVGSDTSATVPTGMDRLNFSNRTNTANHFEGKVYDTRVYNRVLTEAEAIELTTL